MSAILFIFYCLIGANSINADMISCTYKTKQWVFLLKMDANGSGVFNSKELKSNQSYNCKVKAKSIDDSTDSPAPNYKLYVSPTNCNQWHPNFLKDMGIYLDINSKNTYVRVQWLETMQYQNCATQKVNMFDIKTSVQRYNKNQWPLIK